MSKKKNVRPTELVNWSLVSRYCPKDCIYIGSITCTAYKTCDYLLITGEPRGCDLIGCTKYKSGKKGTLRGWQKENQDKLDALMGRIKDED